MKILWFTNTSAMYHSDKGGYNGGGWIEALQSQIMENCKDIQLGVSFFSSSFHAVKKEKEGVEYYPMPLYRSKFDKIKSFFLYDKREEYQLSNLLSVVKDFQPDIIHIFGSENSFGLISQFTNIPVIIHLQGILTPYVNAWFPPGYSYRDLFFSNGLNLLKSYRQQWAYKNNVYMADRERRILKNCKYFMGRTEWDKRSSMLYSPNSEYFYCSEILREQFYKASPNSKYSNKGKLIIMSTISSPLYKGVDMALKIAALLKEYTDIEFEWRVFGLKDISFAEKRTKINSRSVNIKLCGIASTESLIENLKESHIFIHPSYIDNSPNSVCEAQMMGLPVIACNVGGVSSLIEHKINGYLVPANDPYMAVSYIKDLYNDSVLDKMLRENARTTAYERHLPATILKDLLTIYEKLYAKRMDLPL